MKTQDIVCKCRISQESVVALYEELSEYDWEAASKVSLLYLTQWPYRHLLVAKLFCLV